MLPKIHLGVGLLALLAFLLTGQYMGRIADVPGMDDVPRLLYRSSHIYLFFAAAINIFLGLYFRPLQPVHIGTWLNSLVLLATPLLLLFSFATEPALGSIDRGVGRLGVILVFIGLLNAVAGHVWREWRGVKSGR